MKPQTPTRRGGLKRTLQALIAAKGKTVTAAELSQKLGLTLGSVQFCAYSLRQIGLAVTPEGERGVYRATQFALDHADGLMEASSLATYVKHHMPEPEEVDYETDPAPLVVPGVLDDETLTSLLNILVPGNDGRFTLQQAAAIDAWRSATAQLVEYLR